MPKVTYRCIRVVANALSARPVQPMTPPTIATFRDPYTLVTAPASGPEVHYRLQHHINIGPLGLQHCQHVRKVYQS